MLEFLKKKMGIEGREQPSRVIPDEGSVKPVKTEDKSVQTDKENKKDANLVGKRIKVWKEVKKPIRMGAIGVSKNAWDKKRERDMALKAVKAKERELKEEKETERRERIERIKAKHEARAERERFELMAAKMHAKKVERLRRREKRNKLLKER
jgi:rRNA-processing protein CGR1